MNAVHGKLRSKARRIALQALYQIEMTGDPAGVVKSQFCSDQNKQNLKGTDITYFEELLDGIDLHRSELLATISPVLDRSLDKLDKVEKAILLIGSYELLHRADIPYRVSINEGIELAKQFGATESHRYINSILDSLAQQKKSD